jgi:Cytochrome C oxidase subunit II, transmembrane domain
MTSQPFFGGHDVKKTILAAAAMLLMTGIASANQAVNWGLDLQDSSSDMMTQIRWFFDYTLWFVVPITLFVLGLLVYVGWRFSEKNNPVHADRNHLDSWPGFGPATHRRSIFPAAHLSVHAAGRSQVDH